MTEISKYKLNRTMLRVKDLQRSLAFYQFLGLNTICQSDHPETKVSTILLAYDTPGALSTNRHLSDRSGVLELVHNHGTENDPDFAVANGNTEPYRGFGHIAVSVDNIEAACQRLEDAGHPFQKKLKDGRMKNIAFVKDPNGYWVEIIRRFNEDVATTTNPSTYRLNHTMIRVKSAEDSVKFYQEVIGMTLLRLVEMKNAACNLYFLGYPEANPEAKEGAANPLAEWEGLLELTWNYGTEKQEGKIYHDGNKEPQGFGHITISVDDLGEACARFESLNVEWKKRLSWGSRHAAYLLDPDGYWIEVIQNQAIKRTTD